MKEIELNTSLTFQELFKQYQEVWDDCYLGYVIIPNKSKLDDYKSITQHISNQKMYDFYPWLNEKEQIQLPKNGLHEINQFEFIVNLVEMAKEAINYGSHKKISNNALNILAQTFVNEFHNPKYYSNFEGNNWTPVTYHSRDSFLCVVNNQKIGMWLSIDDE